MKKYTIQILMLLMLVVAMGTTSMAEVFNQQSNKLPRIETSKVIEYAIAPGYAYGYSLDANAGQEMTVRISSVENRAVFKIYSPLGKTLDGASEAQNTRYWRGILPVSGEYRIIVRGTTQAHTEFKLKIITQDVPYHNETNLNVFLNRLAPEKPEPNPMVSETKSVKRPASENSLLNILEAMNPVQSKPAAQVSKTGTSEANFVKMLEAMKVPVKIPAQSEKPESQAADKTEKSEVHQKSEAVAKRKSWAYKHTIHPTLPELTFKLIGSVQNAQTAEIAAIEFYQDNEQKPFQTFSNLDIPIAVPKKESSFKLKDMNSDGYQDFFLVTTSASEFYVCWVFDPKAKMFVKLLLDCGW
jgi:hypothetical protein